ncbi:MAG: arginine--tRNA ligase [Dictyoglomi bacterium]|nr:arginine--tRNA ligase [Dictyoglomota bacterium]
MRFIIGKEMANILGVEDIPEIRNTSTEKGKGELSSPVGFMMARKLKKRPDEITKELAEALSSRSWAERIEHKGGFLNIYLSPFFLLQHLYGLSKGKYEEIAQFTPQYKKRIQVEYVSANPTGPLHVAHGRGAAVGSTLVNIFKHIGLDTTAEFYINDGGEQIKKFALSILERVKEIKGLPFDIESIDGGYKGEYLKDIAEKLLERHPNILDMPQSKALDTAAEFGIALMLQDQKEVLKTYKVEFDVWRSEKDIRREGWVEKTINLLKERGLTYESDGALWLKTTVFGDDKDRVLIKKNGEYTYFAVDVAYHFEKHSRGFDIVYDIWGSDHYGHIGRMKAAMKGLGLPDDFLQVIVIQIVRFLKDGEPIKMSKRAGTFTLLSELIDLVGVDAARFYFLMYSPDNSMDFDLDLAVKKSMDNPVYYVQYSYTRALSLKRKAEEASVTVPTLDEVKKALEMYTPSEEEKLLLINLADIRYQLMLSAKNLSPHYIVNYAKDLAGMLHSFYQSKRVLDAESDSARVFRMALIDRFVEVMGLLHDLMGIEKKEHM